MVRFVRADGSKGSNKRQLEEPTPWVKMVTQLESNKRRKKSKDGAENRGNDGTPELTMKKVVKKTMKKVVKKKRTMHNPAKKSKKVKKGMKTSELQYTITPEGKRVKVFREGTQRTWFDLPYEESDLMTRYDNMSARKEMVEEEDRLKTALQEEGLDKEEMMSNMMKAKRKAHQQLRAELIHQQKNLISEATDEKGKVNTVSKKVKGTKKNNGTISPKKKNQKPLMTDNGSGSSQEKTSSVEKMDDDADTEGKDDVKVVVTTSATGKVKKTNNTGNKSKTNKKTNKGKLTNGVPALAGSEVNTKSEVKRGFWVLCEDVENLEAASKRELLAAKKREVEAIYAARTNEIASSQTKLTEEEELALRNTMKKLKSLNNQKLDCSLSKMVRKSCADVKKKVGKKGNPDVAFFFGVSWDKEAAGRLNNLKEKLFKEGLSKEEVCKVIAKERLKEGRLLRNERKGLCLNCQQPGHMALACPKLVQAVGEGQPFTCYTCGSAEHGSTTCSLRKISNNGFSFAMCLICKEAGHISHQCPDNPKGVYPKGGACPGCGSVEHLAKNCPHPQKEEEECNIRVGPLEGEELEALDENEEADSDQDPVPSPNKSDKPKVVKL